MAARKFGSAYLMFVAAGIVLCLAVLGVPSIIAYHYFANYEGKMTIFKTPEQWIAENPEDAKTLTYNGDKADMVTTRNGYTFHLNERIDSENIESYAWPDIKRHETRLVDRKTKIVLAKEVRFTMGDCSNAMPVFFWIHECDPPFRIGRTQLAYQQIGRRVDSNGKTVKAP
jgi:hypothetical protein